MAGDSPKRRSRANRLVFPAAEPEYRAARQRCAEACARYNDQAEFASPEQRARLWQQIVLERPKGATSNRTAAHSEGEILPTGRKAAGNLNTRSDITADEATRKAPPAAGSSAVEPGSSHSSGDSQTSPRPQCVSTSPEGRPAIKDTPPPSPEFADVQPKASVPVGQESAVDEYAISTPPPSRKPSRSDLLDSETRGGVESVEGEQEHDPAVTNPFIVDAPYVKPPVHIDYGTNLIVGAGTFINRNFVVIDSPICYVRIGERCLFGPNVTLATVEHPLDADERRGPIGAPSFASDIEIGDECWIAADVKILCGVKIGSGCVIGAGSVVTKVSRSCAR
ncbi:hypothetical protein, variant [Verruconis gallopava]|uniref:Maltose/galactoside acetyltransferase domain-containing protein n=1 Tax=Verruconis gallopava TaxID=253628 RepID=A0A0D2AQH7_9PEZI|nr:hypothetical protein, variant [Verruconis gallopava]KIW01404.1 hypothetical protein, variant [Verruconis gallopava]